MSRKTVVTFLLLLCALATRADSDVEEKIMKIKLDTAYVSAEARDADEQAASVGAMRELADIVNNLRTREGKNPLEANDLSPLAERISYEETGKHYVFLYVKVDSALNLVKQPEKVQTPPDSSSVDGSTLTPVETTRPYTAVNAMLLRAGDGNEAFRFLEQFKEQGAIDDYGKAKAPGDIPADAYKLLVSGADLSIIAILSPQDINIRTNKTDDINNYSNKAVVWYK